MSERRSEKRESRKKAKLECIEKVDQAKVNLETLLSTLKDQLNRLTNACSNLETAVDEKKEEVRVLALVIEALINQGAATSDRNLIKEAAYFVARFGVTRPAEQLTRVQTHALAGVFGDTHPHFNIVGADVLEDRFLVRFPQFQPNNGPPPYRRERAPNAGETLTTAIENDVGVLTQAAKNQLRDARQQFEAAIAQALTASRGAAPNAAEVDQVAFGLVLHKKAFPNGLFGL